MCRLDVPKAERRHEAEAKQKRGGNGKKQMHRKMQ
jgi:hypothetical protein